MPRRVEIPIQVGSNRAAAINAIAARRQVSLGLELRARGVRTGVQEWRARLAARGIYQTFRLCFVGPIPGHVDAPVAAEGELPSPDRSCCYRAPVLAVDADWCGERRAV